MVVRRLTAAILATAALAAIPQWPEILAHALQVTGRAEERHNSLADERLHRRIEALKLQSKVLDTVTTFRSSRRQWPVSQRTLPHSRAKEGSRTPRIRSFVAYAGRGLPKVRRTPPELPGRMPRTTAYTPGSA